MAKADFPVVADPTGHEDRGAKLLVPKGKSETLDRLSAKGRTGVVSGKGYFDWGDSNPGGLCE